MAQHKPAAILHRELCFFSDPEHGEVAKYVQDDPELPGTRNYEHNRVVVPIKDIRYSEETFKLDVHSFTTLPNAFNTNGMLDLHSHDVIAAIFIPAMVKLILGNVPGASKVVVYDATTRKASRIKVANRQVNKLHVDQSPKGAYLRAKRHLAEEDFEAVTNGSCRLRIINVWKPTSGIVKDHPLVLTDHRSIHEEDLTTVTQIYPDYVGETNGLRYRKGQQFWYWSDMGTADIILFQCFDSVAKEFAAAGTRHSQCIHGSFELDASGNERCDRESIELRCLVLG